jgi:hypothetical protein
MNVSGRALAMNSRAEFEWAQVPPVTNYALTARQLLLFLSI